MSGPVKVRGGGYGLDAELAQRAAEKYDYDMENEAREWIEEITKSEIGDDFGEGLRNGVILCELVNKIHPGVVKRMETKSTMPFKVMENVSAFLKACRIIGVNEFDLFETVDLFELKDLGVVVRCLHALGRTVQKNYPSFDGPTLGVRESSQNVRQFSDRQLAQARNAPVLLNLGSMRTMSRLEVSHAGDVTFGAQAAKSAYRPPPPPPPPSAEKKEFVARARAEPHAWEVAAAPAPAPAPVAAPSYAANANASVASVASIVSQLRLQESEAVKTKMTASETVTPPPSSSPSSSSSPSPPRSTGLAGLNRAMSDKDFARAEVQEWIEEVLEKPFEAEFGEYLKNGVVLCQLMNIIRPGLIPRIQMSSMPFKQMENITAFIKACRAVGVAEFDLFETVDLFELKNIDVVVKCVLALGRTLQKNVPEYTGPQLGVKEATVNKRTFSEAQLHEAAFAVPLLAHGGAGIMERPTVDRSASITFKSDAATVGPVAAAAGESIAEEKAPEATAVHTADFTKNLATKSQTMPSRTVWS